MVDFRPVNTHEPPKLDTSSLEKVEASLQHRLLPAEGAQAGGRTQRQISKGLSAVCCDQLRPSSDSSSHIPETPGAITSCDGDCHVFLSCPLCWLEKPGVNKGLSVYIALLSILLLDSTLYHNY